MQGVRRPVIKKKRASTGNCCNIERVIGITAQSNSGVAVSPNASEIAYTAAGCIVLYNVPTNQQVQHIFNTNSRVFSCIAISPDGRFLATGEGACRQPEIAIWDFQAGPSSIIKVLRGHRYGVGNLAFSPSGENLVSIGSEHDKGMFVWNWQSEQRLTSNKLTKRVNDISFAESGQFFVTAGSKSLKYWFFNRMGQPICTASSANSEVKCMSSKTVDLAEMRDKNFVSVACAKGTVFTLTEDGILCVFTAERVMDKWMELHVSNGYTLCASNNLLACGCSDGIIRCFDSESLEHIITLPRPPPLGEANISPDKHRVIIPTNATSNFADTVALQFFDNNNRLFSMYSDRTVFIWDLRRLEGVSVHRSFLNHSGAINDLKILPTSTVELTHFVTGSTDKTIRIWNVFHAPPKQLEHLIVKNVYSRDLSRIIYLKNSVSHFKRQYKPQQEEEAQIKCIACSPDGQYVASGDTTGMLRVHDLETLQQVMSLQAHESDILCMDYTGKQPSEDDSHMSQGLLLATGSRDRLIHIFRADRNYELVGTMDDHSSSIFDICFVKSEGQERLLSCAADKATIFRTLNSNTFSRYTQNIQKIKKCYQVKSHPIHKTVVTGEDKAVKVWDLITGKCNSTYEDYNDRGVKVQTDSNTKISLDRSGMLIAACGLDRWVRILDYYSGKLLGKVNMGEMCTAAAFTANGKKLITCTADGCIFLWRMSREISDAIQNRLKSANMPLQRSIPQLKDQPAEKQKEEYKIHESMIPKWAKSDLSEPQAKQEQQSNAPFKLADNPIPGKWGQQATIEIGFEDVDVSVQSEKPSELISEDGEQAPVAESSGAAEQNQFVVTKSIIVPEEVKKVNPRESEIEDSPRDVFYDAESEEDIQETPDDYLEEKQPQQNVMRQSLSASFWLKKQKSEQDEPKDTFFQIEKVESDDPVRPPPVVKKRWNKQEEVIGINQQISGVKEHLKQIGALQNTAETKNWIKNRRKKEEDIFDKGDDIVDRLDEPIFTNPQKFNNPYNQQSEEDISEQSIMSEKDYEEESLQQSQIKFTRTDFNKGFQDLRQSLREVRDFFLQVDTQDPEYSVSMEESSEVIGEIHELLHGISNSLGGTLAQTENQILEKFANKLITTVQSKMRSKHRKREKESG